MIRAHMSTYSNYRSQMFIWVYIYKSCIQLKNIFNNIVKYNSIMVSTSTYSVISSFKTYLAIVGFISLFALVPVWLLNIYMFEYYGSHFLKDYIIIDVIGCSCVYTVMKTVYVMLASLFLCITACHTTSLSRFAPLPSSSSHW